MSKPLPSNYNITGHFDHYKSGKYHNGSDYSCPRGTTVYAMRPGKVVSASANDINWAGTSCVKIEIGKNEYDLYAHLMSKTVSAGTYVQAKSVIGKSGGQKGGHGSPEGNSTGPHLHVSTYKNSKWVNPALAINWGVGDPLPEPGTSSTVGNADGSTTDPSTATPARPKGDFDAAAKLIDIDELRKSVFNPSMFDGSRLHKMYPDIASLNTADKNLGRGWIVRDPAALEGIENLPEKDTDQPEESVDGDPNANLKGAAVIQSADVAYGIGPKYGFRFLANPTTHIENYTTVAGLDVGGYLMDLAATNAPPMTTATGSAMAFSVLLDRQTEHWMLAKYGPDEVDWRKDYYEYPPTKTQLENIARYGTMMDLEYLFRTLNGAPMDGLWHGRRTSDFGILAPFPILVSLGDSKRSRRIRGSITAANFNHIMFAPGMIPIRTVVAFSIMRITDSYYTNEVEDLPASSTGPDLSNPNLGPGNGSGPASTHDKNMNIGRGIFTTKYGSASMAKSWSNHDWDCLVKLWNRESQWNHKAHNKKSSTYNGTIGSGAYGIPQSMPGTKMKEEGADWLTNPVTQINWGLKYIKSRYGNPTKAWAHSEKWGWY